MSKMVYLPYVRFEQEEGEAEGIGWYFTQYNTETREGRGGHLNDNTTIAMESTR